MGQETNLPIYQCTNPPIYQPGGLLFCGPLPSGHPAWVLPSTVPCGARTFLAPHTGRDRLAGLGANCMITYCQWLSRGVLLLLSKSSPEFTGRQVAGRLDYFAQDGVDQQ